jgi:hypothetical protein
LSVNDLQTALFCFRNKAKYRNFLRKVIVRLGITKEPSNPTHHTVERRKEPRFPATGVVRVISDDGEEIQADLVNISSSGLCIRVRKILYPGTQIEVKLSRKTVIFAEVRYILPVLTDEFDVGLSIEDVVGEPHL